MDIRACGVVEQGDDASHTCLNPMFVGRSDMVACTCELRVERRFCFFGWHVRSDHSCSIIMGRLDRDGVSSRWIFRVSSVVSELVVDEFALAGV